MMDKRRSSRFLASMRRIIEELFPELSFHLGSWRYRVKSVSGNFVSVEPWRNDLGLPNLTRLPFHGAPGVTGTLQVGTMVVVTFTDGDGPNMESKVAYISAVEGPDGAGFLPTELRLDASSTVDIGASAGTVNVGTGARVHVGKVESYNPLTVAGRFIRSGDTVQLGSTTGVINIVGGSQSTAGT